MGKRLTVHTSNPSQQTTQSKELCDGFDPATTFPWLSLSSWLLSDSASAKIRRQWRQNRKQTVALPPTVSECPAALLASNSSSSESMFSRSWGLSSSGCGSSSWVSSTSSLSDTASSLSTCKMIEHDHTCMKIDQTFFRWIRMEEWDIKGWSKTNPNC